MTDFKHALSVQLFPVGKKEGQKPKKDAFVYCYIDPSTLTPMRKKVDLGKYSKTHPFDLPFTNLACLARYVRAYLENNPTLDENKVKKIKTIFGEIIDAKGNGLDIDVILANVTPLSVYWDPEGLTQDMARKMDEEDLMFYQFAKPEFVYAGPSHVYKHPPDTKKVGLVPDSISLMPASAVMEPSDVGYDRAGFVKSLREIVGPNFVSLQISKTDQLFFEAPKTISGVQDKLIQVNKRATNALTPKDSKLPYKIYGNTAVIKVNPVPLKVTPPKANTTKIAKAEKDAQNKKQAIKKNRDSVKSIPKTTKTVKPKGPSRKKFKEPVESSMEITKTDTVSAVVVSNGPELSVV